jgi:hypothetical protein
MNYAYHTIDRIQCLITNPRFEPSQQYVQHKGYLAYANIYKKIYGMPEHANHTHREVYLKYQNAYLEFLGF